SCRYSYAAYTNARPPTATSTQGCKDGGCVEVLLLPVEAAVVVDFGLVVLAALVLVALVLAVLAEAFLDALANTAVNTFALPGVGELVHCHTPFTSAQLRPSSAF